MSDNTDAKSNDRGREKRRVTVTQLLKSPVLNAAGEEVGRLADLIAKLADTGYPPITGMKVSGGGLEVFVGRQHVAKLQPGAVQLSTSALDMTPFQRRQGEVLLAADVLGRHLVDMARGRLVQAHDLVLGQVDGQWRLLGVDRSPRAMLRRLVPRRARPDLRRHALLDWKDVQPFVAHVPTAKLLVPLQRLRRLHPAQIADLVEGASHDEGEEIMDAVESDAELTADVFEELDTEHQLEFLKARSNEEVAAVLDKMAPDDAADLLGELDQPRRKPVFDLISAHQQHKLRTLLQYHPSSAGGMMSPDYVSVRSSATVAEALQAVREDDRSPRQLLSSVFVTDQDGKYVGSVTAADLIRANPDMKIDQLDLVGCSIPASADLADVTLLMADYNLTAVAVLDSTHNLIGAVTADDVIEAIVPEQWRNRAEASSGV